MQTDGRHFVLETPYRYQTLRIDHVTDAPAPLEKDTRWIRALKARRLYEGREDLDDGEHQCIFDHLRDHQYTPDGQQELQVRWFGYTAQDDTWQMATSLPQEAVRKYVPARR